MAQDTLDLLSQSSTAALEAMLADAALSDVPVDQLKIINVQSDGGTLTNLTVALELNAADLTTWKYGGEMVLTYNRIDLADLFSGITLQFIPDSYPTTVTWLCQQIASVGLINFDPIDFVNETITEAMAVHYLLKADPKSLRYVGQVPVSLFKHQPLIRFFIPHGGGAPITTMADLINISDPLGIGTYSQDTNGTIMAADIKKLTAGYNFTVPYLGTPLQWNLFNRILNQPSTLWVIDASGAKPNNGYGAVVTYNGPINPAIDKPFNPNLDQVCRVKLNSSYCTNWSGTLSIYYSLIHVES